jgi:hypothetical protein
MSCCCKPLTAGTAAVGTAELGVFAASGSAATGTAFYAAASKHDIHNQREIVAL